MDFLNCKNSKAASNGTALTCPEMHQTWGEYKREIKKNRKRRLSWMQRVMGYTKEDFFRKEILHRDSEDEDEDEDEDDFSDGEEVLQIKEEQHTKFPENLDKVDGFEDCSRTRMDDLVRKSQETDFEKQLQALDFTERFEPEGQGESMIGVQDFNSENAYEPEDWDPLGRNSEPGLSHEECKEASASGGPDFDPERMCESVEKCLIGSISEPESEDQEASAISVLHCEMENAYTSVGCVHFLQDLEPSSESSYEECQEASASGRPDFKLEHFNKSLERCLVSPISEPERESHVTSAKGVLDCEMEQTYKLVEWVNLSQNSEPTSESSDDECQEASASGGQDFEPEHKYEFVETCFKSLSSGLERKREEECTNDRIDVEPDVRYESEEWNHGCSESELEGQASACGGQDFARENTYEEVQLDHLRSSEETDFELNNEAELYQEEEEQRFEDIGNEIEDLAMGLAMGAMEEAGNRDRCHSQNMDNLPFDGNLEKRSSDDDAADINKFEQSVEHHEQPSEHDSGFDSQHSAFSDSENGEPFYERTYNPKGAEDQDLELKSFKDFMETDFETASTQEGEVVAVTTKTKNEHLEEEEATTTDEDDDISGDADTDYYDLDETKMYIHENHVIEMFQTLKDFKDAHILTDLELKTSDGRSTHVHSIVLSGVCYLIKRSLGRHHSWERKTVVHRVSEEVEFEALQAVIEYAYSGKIQNLNNSNVYDIKTAARYLRAPTVMDICDRELAKNKGSTGKKNLSPSSELKMCLQEIRQLWLHEMGCDVTLDVLSASFEVHRVILAASSDYFRAMFTLGMKESTQSSVYLQFLSAPEISALLECSYSGSIPLSWNCIFEVTSTALQLQYQPALDLCLKFLHKDINPFTCLDVASFAEAFGMLQLLEFSEDYILRQFQKVARTPKFKDLPARNLFKYLSSFALCVPSELVVFRAVVDWIQAKPKKRLKLAKELMKTIHFPLMTFKDFKEVQALKMWSSHSLHELYEAIFEDFCSNQTETQSKCRIYVPKESLVLSGGDQISEDLGTRSISKDLWFGNSLKNLTGIRKAMGWRKLCEMPPPARFSHEVAVINGFMYVVGGKKYYGTGDTLSSVFRYDPNENSWKELTSMHQARCCYSLVALESMLYAIGGQCHPDYIENVERYCPKANSWSFVRPLDLPLGGHVARVVAGQIYVSGGLNDDYESLSSLFSYDPEKGCTYLENMNRPRALHCMEVLGDCLYVAGGLSQTDTGIIDMLACEMYNPLADSWTSFPPLPVPHVGSGSAVLEGKFYVLGGYSQDDYSDTKMIHRYDPAIEQWENLGKMPGPNNDLRACVLCLPEHLRQSPD